MLISPVLEKWLIWAKDFDFALVTCEVDREFERGYEPYFG